METPSNEIFEEMQRASINIWNTYDDTYGYATEKIDYVKNLENIQDNAMVFYRMFDYINQNKMMQLLSSDSIYYVSKNQ